MPERPRVLLSVAASIDGYIDDASDERLLLSNDEDFDRVDAVRAQSDAIMVGANTIRADNPRLLVRSAERRQARVAAGQAESPIKVTLTSHGDLDPEARFFTSGDVPKLVYTGTPAVDELAKRLAPAAEVIDAGNPTDLRFLLADLYRRGVRSLMVEGGSTIHTQFLTSGQVDEIHLVIAPFLVGDSAAPRFVRDGQFPWDSANRLHLAEARQIGDVVLLRYVTR